MKQRNLILQGSPCETNLFNGGPETLAEARSMGSQKCPKYGECSKGTLHPQTGQQCVMQFGFQVAGFVAKGERQGVVVASEMADLSAELPNPSKGWISSKDRKTFEVLTERSEVLAAIEAFAREVLYGPEGTTDPRLEVGDSFEAVATYSIRSEPGGPPVVDTARLDSLEGRFGSNGGRGCDVRSGPCSCGAWH